jgi:hypothetical protein
MDLDELNRANQNQPSSKMQHTTFNNKSAVWTNIHMEIKVRLDSRAASADVEISYWLSHPARHTQPLSICIRP